MSRKRRKQHQSGERLSVYLNKDLPPHFFDWLNKQDDVSAFVLYAMQCLYAQTGDVDLSEELPRKFYFRGTENAIPPQQGQQTQPIIPSHTNEVTDIREVKVTNNVEKSTVESFVSTKGPFNASDIEVATNTTSSTKEAAKEPVYEEKIEIDYVSADLSPQDNHVEVVNDLENIEEPHSSDGQWANLDKIDIDSF